MRRKAGLVLGLVFGVLATIGGWWFLLSMFDLTPVFINEYTILNFILGLVTIAALLCSLAFAGPFIIKDTIQDYQNGHENRHPIHYGEVLELMEKKYQEKIPEYGDSWKDCDVRYFVKRILEEIEEINNSNSREERLSEAVDIANFAIMLLAIARGYGHAWPRGHIPGRAFRSMGGP